MRRASLPHSLGSLTLVSFLSAGCGVTWQTSVTPPVETLARESPPRALLIVRDVGSVVIRVPRIEGDSLVVGTAERIGDRRVDENVRYRAADILELRLEEPVGDWTDHALNLGAAALAFTLGVIVFTRP